MNQFASRSFRSDLFFVFMAVLIGWQATAVRAATASSIWIEGETPTSSNVTVIAASVEKPALLSGGKWLLYNVDANKSAEVPADGAAFTYQFEITAAGAHEIWARVGFDMARSAFAVSLDAAAPIAISPEFPSTDLTALGFFCDTQWLKITDATLTKGTHSLEFRIPRGKNAQDKPDRTLFALDAICISAGPFHPNLGNKPDAIVRSATDDEAAKNIFILPDAKSSSERVSVDLKGLWEVTRHDEFLPKNVDTPIADLPANPAWSAIAVPSNKNKRDDLVFAHRLFYRTKVNVPASHAGRSFVLHFLLNNLNTTVYVNGVLCGFEKNPFVPFDIDITKAIKPGQVNEIWVGIRDAWYGYTENPNRPLKLRRTFCYPKELLGRGFQDFAYPIWNLGQNTGILGTPTLSSVGTIYTADIYCNPSVSNKKLALEITLTNPTTKDATGELITEAINETTGKSVKNFAPQTFTLAAGKSQTLKFENAWDNPTLWWPDAPAMYSLRATLNINGKPVDVKSQSFGFRQWSVDGIHVRLNGMKWHGFSDICPAKSLDEMIEFTKKENQTTYRWRDRGIGMFGVESEQALARCDRAGVVIRLEGSLDGETIGYNALENDPDLKTKYNSNIKVILFDNTRDQLVAQVKAFRNHPCLAFWAMDNEFSYINCYNLYAREMPQFEAKFKEIHDAIHAVHPQALVMLDGNGAGQTHKLQIHSDHYIFSNPANFGLYPAEAYKLHPKMDRAYQEWDEQRPRFPSEDYYASGIDPFDYTFFGGEECFQGKGFTKRAAGIMARMVAEGYRWSEYCAFQLFLDRSQVTDITLSYKPLAVFCKNWDWTFASSQNITREMGIFNDTRSTDPITFNAIIMLAGKEISRKSSTHTIAPGENQKFNLELAMPAVTQRTEGQCILQLLQNGVEKFREAKPLSLLPAASTNAKFNAGDLLVLDPSGQLIAFLQSRKIAFTAMDSLQNLQNSGKLLIVGKDALNAKDSISDRLATYAATGRRVIVLEQKHPLKYQGVQPAEMEPATNEGRTAFIEDANSPSLRNLTNKDFFTWGSKQNPEVVYRNAYFKPTRGGKSLIQCDHRLEHSALVEIPVSNGLMLLTQLMIEEKLADNIVAQTLMTNLIDHALDYKLDFLNVAAVVNGDAVLSKTISEIGLKYSETSDPLSALNASKNKIALIAATPANLKIFAENKGILDAFTAAGGSLVLAGLTPEGLADYNRIVGFEHMIRPFRRERVTMAAPRHPLSAGLTLGDVVMYSSERIFSFMAGDFVANDEFQYVVDLDDVAPFAKFPNAFSELMVNGFVNADAWKYIVNAPIPNDGKGPLEWELKFPKPQEFMSVEFINNLNYWPSREFKLIPDGNANDAVTFAVDAINEPQNFNISPAIKAQNITLSLTKFDVVPGKNVISGLDNIRLFAVRPADFHQRVRPMLNIGGLIEYPMGNGRIVLCNLWFKEREEVPMNFNKKRTILATILRNLKAPFAGSKTILTGGNLHYTPVDISKFANQFRNEQGWFGDSKFTFKDLPAGPQKFNRVSFDIYEFRTSPVPEVIMLGGPNVPRNLPDHVEGIPINAKAVALFFLQAARIDKRLNDKERAEKKFPEIARYVIHYADGKTAEIPLIAEVNIDHFKQKEPRDLPGAMIAWSKPYSGTDQHAVAYTMQWNNPRPDVLIASIDLVGAKTFAGVPALLAISAAIAEP